MSTQVNNYDSERMGELLGLHMRRGMLQAELNWINCGDPDGITNEFKKKFNEIIMFSRRIDRTKLDINLQLDDSEMTMLVKECMESENNTMLEHEILIEKEFRPSDLAYNMKALIIKTRKHIPEDIIIGLSYGWKFLFPYITTDKNIHEILAQMELCIDETIPTLFHHEAYADIARILNNRGRITLNCTVQWLVFLAKRTERFFKMNKDLFATRSDKGAHTVLLDTSLYETEIGNMLNNPSYTLVSHDPLEEMVNSEKEIMKIFSMNFKTKPLVEQIYEPDTKQLAKFYGLPKVHKEVFALRPITAMSLAPGHASGKVFNKMLNIIFPKTDFHIRDSYEMKKFVDTVSVGEDEILVSFDVVSMYTNIPRELVKTIIMDKQKLFHTHFGIGRILLVKILDFLLVKTTVFTAVGRTYKQNEGLPMGGCISTTLARIVMDLVAENLLLHEPNISFIRIFVDDTIAAVKRGSVLNALRILNEFHPNMKFTHEVEDQRRSINFLNLTLFRDGNRITSNWYRKHFASGRLLPYYSSHKRTTIMATAGAFIETVIQLSDPFFFNLNRSIVERTLYDNGFPESVVQVLMNDFYTLMKRKPLRNRMGRRYKIFPHAICESKHIKKVLHKLKYSDIVYAESTKNTKINFVKTRKTPTPMGKKGNLILGSTCQCGLKKKFTSTKFNETGEIASVRFLTKFQHCNSQNHAFRKFEYIKGLAYKKQTDYLLKYVEWKHRANTLEYRGMPNYKFVKILHNKCKKLHKKKC